MWSTNVLTFADANGFSVNKRSAGQPRYPISPLKVTRAYNTSIATVAVVVVAAFAAGATEACQRTTLRQLGGSEAVLPEAYASALKRRISTVRTLLQRTCPNMPM